MILAVIPTAVSDLGLSRSAVTAGAINPYGSGDHDRWEPRAVRSRLARKEGRDQLLTPGAF